MALWILYLQLHIEQLKQQSQNELLGIEKQLVQAHAERDSLRQAKDALTVQLTKKETDFDNLLERMREHRNKLLHDYRIHAAQGFRVPTLEAALQDDVNALNDGLSRLQA